MRHLTQPEWSQGPPKGPSSRASSVRADGSPKSASSKRASVDGIPETSCEQHSSSGQDESNSSVNPKSKNSSEKSKKSPVSSVKNGFENRSRDSLELDSDYLNANLKKKRETNGKFGVIGVSELERLYRSASDLNFSAIRKPRSNSVEVELGSTVSSSVTTSTLGSVYSSNLNFPPRVTTPNKDSKVTDEPTHSKSACSTSSSFSSRRSSRSAVSAESDGSKNSISNRHRILSAHSSPITALGVSVSGLTIVSAEEGYPVGKVTAQSNLNLPAGMATTKALLYHRTCKPDFLCSWPSLNSYLK